MTITKVAEIISNTVNCKIEDVVMDARLEDLGVDSLKAITILYDLEEEYDIEIPNELIETIQTVADIVCKIDELRAEKAA